MQFCSHGAFKVYSETSSLQFTNTQMTEKVLFLQNFLKDDLHVAQINSKYSSWFLNAKSLKTMFAISVQYFVTTKVYMLRQ